VAGKKAFLDDIIFVISDDGDAGIRAGKNSGLLGIIANAYYTHRLKGPNVATSRRHSGHMWPGESEGGGAGREGGKIRQPYSQGGQTTPLPPAPAHV
jgi:hypothetical protein